MVFEGKITLKANIQKLWDSILKPEILGGCVPGSETLELTGENAYAGTMKQKVGPFSIKISYTANLVELTPPTHLKATMKGEMLGGMGQFVGDMLVDFKDVGSGQVELTYKINANITGKVAVVGDRVMRVKAKAMEADISKNFQEKLGS